MSTDPIPDDLVDEALRALVLADDGDMDDAVVQLAFKVMRPHMTQVLQALYDAGLLVRGVDPQVIDDFYDEWRMNHAEHCTDLENCECPMVDNYCHWPMPATLRALRARVVNERTAE